MNTQLLLFILLLAFPVGLLIAHLCRDELIQGRRWFLRTFIVAALGAAILTGTGNIASGTTSAFISIVTLISYRKSFDKTWKKKR